MSTLKFRALPAALLSGLLAACGGGGSDSNPPPNPPPTPSATLTLNPTSGSLAPGANTTITATVTRAGGFDGAVTVGSSGVPAGVTVTGGTVATGATTQSITLTVAANATSGTSNLSITGTASGITITPVTFALTITQPPPPPVDTDGDGQPDATDSDDDNDGVLDVSDLMPLDPARTQAISAAFPRVNGVYQLPDYPVTRQLTWILQQLAPTATTTTADINAHFAPATLASIPAATWLTLFQNLRAAAPNGIVVDLILASPTDITALIGVPGAPASGQFVTLSTGYASNLIKSFGASPFALNGSVITQADQALTMAAAADRYVSLGDQSSLLVARITNNACTPIEQRSATTPRATASIFKTWVLGGLAKAVNDGQIAANSVIGRAAAETVRGSSLASEPLGTQFPLQDMATLMMGISDNTATDHLHQLVGRPRLESILATFNHSNPALLTPFLSVNETFNLFAGVPLNDAQAYATGTESFQRSYVDTVLEPLGPVTGFGNNTAVFISGSWQATAMDVCNAFAGIRKFNDRSEGFQIADRALSSQVAQPGLRNRWERVWYKGGSLDTGAGLVVLTHAWMLQSDSRGTFVVVAMNNRSAPSVDQFAAQSATGRILQLLDQQNP